MAVDQSGGIGGYAPPPPYNPEEKFGAPPPYVPPPPPPQEPPPVVRPPRDDWYNQPPPGQAGAGVPPTAPQPLIAPNWTPSNPFPTYSAPPSLPWLSSMPQTSPIMDFLNAIGQIGRGAGVIDALSRAGQMGQQARQQDISTFAPVMNRVIWGVPQTRPEDESRFVRPPTSGFTPPAPQLFPQMGPVSTVPSANRTGTYMLTGTAPTTTTPPTFKPTGDMPSGRERTGTYMPTGTAPAAPKERKNEFQPGTLEYDAWNDFDKSLWIKDAAKRQAGLGGVSEEEQMTLWQQAQQKHGVGGVTTKAANGETIRTDTSGRQWYDSGTFKDMPTQRWFGDMGWISQMVASGKWSESFGQAYARALGIPDADRAVLIEKDRVLHQWNNSPGTFAPAPAAPAAPDIKGGNPGWMIGARGVGI